MTGMGAKQPAKLGRYLTALRPSRSFAGVRLHLRSRHDWREVEDQAELIVAIHREPGWRDLARRLGLDEQVRDDSKRQVETSNFIGIMARAKPELDADRQTTASPDGGGCKTIGVPASSKA